MPTVITLRIYEFNLAGWSLEWQLLFIYMSIELNGYYRYLLSRRSRPFVNCTCVIDFIRNIFFVRWFSDVNDNKEISTKYL